MQSVLLRPKRDEFELLTAQLWELGTIGTVEEGDCLRAFFLDPIDTSFLSYVVEIRKELEAPAYEFSRQDWTPLLIGSKFFIAPSWVEDSTPEGRLRLTIDSPTAFGTGRHETTQLALGYLEETIQGGETVVDIGCGSGILCAAAKMLGAGTVVGCDIDELAVAAAVRDFGIAAFTGSVDSVCAAYADIVLANISTKVIEALAPELKRAAKPEARVFLSGFIRGSEPRCFTPREVRELGDWSCFIGTETSIRAPQTPRRKIMHHSLHWW